MTMTIVGTVNDAEEQGKYRKHPTLRNVMNLVIGSMGVVLTLAASLTGSLTIVAGLKN